MDGMLVPLIVAAAVATFAWGLIAIVTGSGRGERRKLQERLSGEGDGGSTGYGRNRGNSNDPLGGKSITLQLDVQGVPEFLADRPFIQALNRRMLQAYPDKKLGTFLTTSAIYAVVAGGVTLLVTASFSVGTLAALAGTYFPFMLLSMKANKRQRQIALQLPEALDFLTRILRAGHSLSTGLQMMGEELPQPLCGEFRRAYDQHSLGVSLEDSLRETAARIESSDFAFFVTAVLVQRQTGGDLSEVLKNISAMIRSRVRLAQHVKAKTAEGRFTGYVLVAFPAVMFFLAYYMNPGYAGVLINDPQGRMLLGVAVALQLLGLFAIKKITTVKV
jgi:tight adherence protein B